MIMPPSHGPNTAALQLKVSRQAILQKLRRKEVFVKQAYMKTLPNSSKEIKIHSNNTTQTRVLSQPLHETATYRCDDTRGCVMQF